MSQKSPEAFRTISEVADELDVPQHVLRFWESKFAAVKPLKRGGGRRYYRPGDVDVLRGVKTLLYGEGYTIRGVQKVFRTQGVRYVADVGQSGAQSLSRGPIAAASEPVSVQPQAIEMAEPPTAAAPAGSRKQARRETAQLSLVEPAPLKLSTVERRHLQQRVALLVKLRTEIGRVLDTRAERIAPMQQPRAAGA
jgi:DNA-binding transcriptional MerR regulator